MRARILKCSTCTRNNRSVSPPGLCIVYGAKKNSRKGWLFISIFFHTYRTIYCTSKVLRFLQELFRYGLREISMHHLFIPHRPHNDDVVGPADRPRRKFPVDDDAKTFILPTYFENETTTRVCVLLEKIP